MTIVKTSELIGPALDWAVAKCEGLNPHFFTEREAYDAGVLKRKLNRGDLVIVLRPSGRLSRLGSYNGYNDGVCISKPFEPSTNWAQGGPIIEREKLGVEPWNEDTPGIEWAAQGECKWNSDGDDCTPTEYGSTPLIAAMRCYVASKLGDEVEIPEELMK